MSGASGKPQPSPTPLGSGSEPARNVPAFRRIRKAKRLLIARPLRSHELEAQRLRKWLTLPIFSSVAYATETALAVIVSALVADRGAVLPVSVAIAALLAIVALSYTWIVRVYSTSGGSYVVRLLLLELRVILASVPYRLD